MAISYINTVEVENISKDLNTLAIEFNNEINNLFMRLSEVPSVTKEWVGYQSQFYFKKISNDKIQYNEFANKIKDISYRLSADLYEIQTCINNNNNEERKRDN